MSYLQTKCPDIKSNIEGEDARCTRKAYDKRNAKAYAHFVNLVNRNKFKVEGRLLDAGCRDGGLYEHIKEYFPSLEYIGIDIVQRHIDNAKEQNRPCQQMDWCELDIKDETFDIVFSHHSLEHVWNPDTACLETYRILKKGGIFLLIVPLGEKNLKGDIFNYLKIIGFELLYEDIKRKTEAWIISRKL